MYDASANVLRGEFMHGGAVLDCCFHDDSSGFSASADNTVRRSEQFVTLFFKLVFVDLCGTWKSTFFFCKLQETLRILI